MIDYFRRKKREREDARIRAELIPTLHGKAINYVSERGEDGLDTVLGKEGSISLRDGQIIISACEKDIFGQSSGNVINVKGGTFSCI